MVTKADIFNLALQTLLLNQQIINPESDKSNAAKALQSNWNIALRSALADMNLTSTATRVNLELLAKHPVHHWPFAWKYPSNCAFFRRIIGHEEVDDKDSYIPRLVTIWNGKKVIFSKHKHRRDEGDFNPNPGVDGNPPPFVAEYIQTDFPLQTLQADAAVCVAHRLALLCTSLIVGKGAATLMTKIENSYKTHKALAQSVDRQESFNFETEATMSEFVRERLS